MQSNGGKCDGEPAKIHLKTKSNPSMEKSYSIHTYYITTIKKEFYGFEYLGFIKLFETGS